MKRTALAICVSLAIIAVQQASAQELPHASDWIGNSLSATAPTGFERPHVQNDMQHLWVKSDGTVYTASLWDEDHNAGGIYKNGQLIGGLADTFQDFAGVASVAGGSSYLYAARGKTIRRYHFDGSHAGGFAGSSGPYGDDLVVLPSSNGWVGDISVDAAHNLLFAAVYTQDANNAVTASEIWVFDISSGITFLRKGAVANPGPSAVASDGTVWIIQYGSPSKVLHYDANGTLLAQQITGTPGWNPQSLAFDNSGRLMIADNGPDQNIKFYNNLGGSPTLAATFGATGGIFSGTPGQIAPLKFNGPTGAGMDSGGNILVGQNRHGNWVNGFGNSGSILESYTASGARNWILQALEDVDCADVDPTTESGNVLDVYTKHTHYQLDLSKPTGQTWTPVGHLLNPIKYPGDDRYTSANDNGDIRAGAWIRTLQGRKILFSNSMLEGHLDIYRFNAATDGEVAIPCGQITWDKYHEYLWHDANGNGANDAGEVTAGTSYPGYGVHNAYFWVDTNGDLWECAAGGNAETIRHFAFQGFDANGVPTWDFAHMTEENSPAAIGDINRVLYHAATDTLLVSGYNTGLDPNHYWNAPVWNAQSLGSVIAAYPNWSKGNRTPVWTKVVEYGLNGNNHDAPRAMSVAGDYLFLGYEFLYDNVNGGRVDVYRLSDGGFVGSMHPGGEIGGYGDAMDIDWGLSAFRRSNGEYLIFRESDGFARVTFFRWTPPYRGVLAALPGTIEAEDFDDGGEGAAYHDTSGGNAGGGYRATDVDIRSVVSDGHGSQVGWTDAGEWLRYSVTVTQGGAYQIGFRVASGTSGSAFHLEDETGRNLTGTVTVPNTGGWDTFTTLTRQATLTAGPHVLRLVEEAGGFDINYLTFALAPLAAQFDASALSLSDGAAVGQWPDATGDGYTATVPSGSNAPTFALNAMNGKPVVRFSAAASQMLAFSRPVQDDFTLFCVYRSSQGLGTGNAYYTGAGLIQAEMPGVVPDFGMSLNASGQVLAGTGSPDTFLASGSGLNDGAPHVVTFRRVQSTGAIALYIDGALAASGTGGTASLTAPSLVGLGATVGGFNYLTGDIAEVDVYGVALSDADRSAQESALRSKWVSDGSPTNLIAQ